MAEGLANLGLAGLTHQAGKREQANKDIQTLGQMVQMKKQNEVAEQQAALLEQKYYENIRKEADTLLAGDRKNINKKAKGIQSEIRKNIKLFGGSRKKFMANGGLAMIGDYQNQVLDSDEFQVYKENKVNMERIIDLKKKNLGHLLTPKDQANLEAYERNGTGKITYSGLMSEIKIPESELFDYGTLISPQDILINNTMQLVSNWQLENPDEMPPDPTTAKGRKTLLAYIHAKGYGGHGSHESKFKYEAQRRASEARAKAAKEAKPYHSITGVLSQISTNQKSVSIDNIKDGFEMEKLMDGFIGNKITTKWDMAGTGNPTALEYIADLGGLNSANDPENSFTARGARKLQNRLDVPLLKAKYQDRFAIEGNTIKGLEVPQGEAFDHKGEENAKPIDATDFTIMGSFIGWKGSIDGKQQLFMDATKDTGELDEERTKTLYHTEEGSERPQGSPSTFVMLKDPDTSYDDYIYIEVPFDATLDQAAFKDSIGEFDDITKMVEENKSKSSDLEKAKRGARIEKNSKINKDLDASHDAFTSEIFKMQGTKYNPNGSGALRSNLRRAWYMATQDLGVGSMQGVEQEIKNDTFSGFFESLGLGKSLTNPDLNDSEILNQLDQAMIGNDETEIENNTVLKNKIMNYLISMYNN